VPTQLFRYDIPGHSHFWTISCYRRLTFFWHDAMKRIVIDALRSVQERYRVGLIGYVVMPEHVHLVLYPHPPRTDTPIGISTILHAFKKHVGFHGKQLLTKLTDKEGRLWSDPLTAWANKTPESRSLWTTRGYDFNIDRYETLREKLDYCHKNSVTRGLVTCAEDWP